jgi:hypothetical protein
LDNSFISRIVSDPSVFLTFIVSAHPINHKFLGDNSEPCGRH